MKNRSRGWTKKDRKRQNGNGLQEAERGIFKSRDRKQYRERWCGKTFLTLGMAWDNGERLHSMLAELHGPTHRKKPVINHV